MVRGRGLILICDKPRTCCVLLGEVPVLFFWFDAATGTSTNVRMQLFISDLYLISDVLGDRDLSSSYKRPEFLMVVIPHPDE